MRAQTPPSAQEEYRQRYKRAMAYSELSQYAPCMEELTSAIAFADSHHLEEERIEASITLAETMRRTHDFEKGLQLLFQLEIPATYPKLKVRKLGRIAAIYNERPEVAGVNRKEAVTHYLDSALRIATGLHLDEEQASLYNELGFTISGKKRDEGLAYILKSARLYQSLRDTHNYVGAMTNALRCYVNARDSAKAHAVIDELLLLTHNKGWYTAEIELYPLIATFYKYLQRDTLRARYWYSMVDKSTISNLYSINSAQMNSFRTLYETQQLKAKVADAELQTTLKQEAIDRQDKRLRELFVFLSLLVVLAAGVIALLLRERKLKRRLAAINEQLQQSNEKYQVLLVESNHRIKNNLQMVISMLEYSGSQSGSNAQEAFSRMSGKIRTISSLHRQLSADVHNELVPVADYFHEIIALYKDIAPAGHTVHCEVDDLQIRSERLVYFGLILNEMLANTFAHSATSRAINVTVRASGPAYQFDYADGSVHDPAAAQGTGSGLIRQLIQRVGGTAFVFDPAQGHYQFRFDG